MTRAPTTPVSNHHPAPALRRPHPLVMGLLLAALVILTYWPAAQSGFSVPDDNVYLPPSDAPHPAGPSAGPRRTLAHTHQGNWHPLTTLSHQLDHALVGDNARAIHRQNVLWHGLNAVLVFLVWRALTGATWRPAVLAALFALHPLQAASVAWISGRKELLSGCFWLLGVWAYARYARHPAGGRYLIVVGALLLTLLSNPVALLFPVSLLLLDFWPLRRWPARNGRTLLLEKIPLFALVAVHGVLTLTLPSASPTTARSAARSLESRLSHAPVEYVNHLRQTFWPERPRTAYSNPEYPPPGTTTSTLGLLALTLVIWWHRRTRPWLVFGWSWFFVTLVPVIGLREGTPSLADRHLYLPLLGVFTLAVWQAARLVHLWPRTRGALIAATAALLVAFGLLTNRQILAPSATREWRD